MRVAVIPTHSRELDLADCMRAIAPQVDHIVVVAHDCTYGIPVPSCGLTVLPYSAEVLNISTMWNLGIEAAEDLGAGRIAVLNDDAIVPPHWFNRIEEAMAKTGAKAGSAWEGDSTIWLGVDSSPVPRLQGYAFVVKRGALLDEKFQWWYGDSNLDMESRRSGGTVLVAGVNPEHRHPNSTTVGVLADVAMQDRHRFIDTWGWAY